MNPSRHPIPASTLAGVAIQTGVLAVGGVIALTLRGDPASRAAVGFAAAVCLGGVLGGWAAARWPGSTAGARVAAALAVVVLRIFPALAALGWLQTPAGTRLREAGAGGMLVAFYLAVLAVDVFLNIMGTRDRGQNGAI